MAGDGGRSYAASMFVVDVGGSFQGYAKKASIGELKWDVHESKLGSDLITKKMITNHTYGDFTIDMGVAMGGKLYDWIKASFDKAYTRMDGAVIVANANYDALRRYEYYQALITKIATPKVDGASKDAGYFSITMKPELMKWAPGSGKIEAPIGATQKLWMTNNFRLDIGGLNCTTVRSVDAFSWEQKTVANAYGHLKDAELLPTGLQCSDLTFNIASGEDGKILDDWLKKADAWHQGGSTEKDHKTGTLTFLAQDMKTELGSITFEGMGFKEIGKQDLERGEKVFETKISMYIEHAFMKLTKKDA